MKVYKVSFHWLGKDSGYVHVTADHPGHAISKALTVERSKGCMYKEDNVTKSEFICETEEKQNDS